MPRKRVPKPRLRRGAKTYEVRETIAGKVRVRTLGTTDYDEALRLFPAVYAVMVAEFESPATESTTATGTVRVIIGVDVLLSIAFR